MLEVSFNYRYLFLSGSYVLGNPPFVGKKEQNDKQKADMDLVWGDVQSAGILDYVTAWYRKASQYIKGTRIVVGFVSTNSITQGEQVPVLWGELIQRQDISICFAHRTFAWQSEARGKAHVHVVIIGFASFKPDRRIIFDYQDIKGEPHAQSATNINAYLTDSTVQFVTRRSQPLSDVAEMVFGTKLVDDGHLTLGDLERDELIQGYPFAAKWIRPLTGGEEFLNGTTRWCLWLNEASPNELRSCPPVMERIKRVRDFRLASKKAPTVELAATPSIFGEIRQPDTDYLLFPKVSSERRRFVPLGFLSSEFLANGSALIVPNATLHHFGILSSSMHMAWMRQVCGRMKSDYQYSATIVYNNYPWPEPVSEKQRAAVERAAQRVLAVRAEFLAPGGTSCTSPTSSRSEASQAIISPKLGDQSGTRGNRPSGGKTATLADLYDPLAMPPALAKAHAELDRAVDLCYRPEKFESDRQRVEFLFNLYEQITMPLAMTPKAKPRKQNRPAE